MQEQDQQMHSETKQDIRRAQEMAKIAIAAMEDRKAEDIRVLNIADVSVMADLFLIASGKNRNQIQAIKENVEEQMEKHGFFVKHVEGFDTAHWILMDYGDLILHIFDEESRMFYDLERIWRDGKPVEPESL